MGSVRTSKTVRDFSSRRIGARPYDGVHGRPASNEPVRVLVLDHVSDTPERIENALWTWAHHISQVQTSAEVIESCRNEAQGAVVVAVDDVSSKNLATIAKLRQELPNLAIVAIGSSLEGELQKRALEHGANAFLLRDELHRSTLYDLLKRISDSHRPGNGQNLPHWPQMPPSWRESRMVGALICNTSGTVVDVNSCLAATLEYKDPTSLLGLNVSKDILMFATDWHAWKQFSRDTTELLHQSTRVQTKRGGKRWMEIEVVMPPDAPDHLLVTFVDQTEVAQLTGKDSFN